MHLSSATGKAAGRSAVVVALVATVVVAACGGQSTTNTTAGVLPHPQGAAAAKAGVDPNAVTILYVGGAGIPALAFRQWFDYYGVALPPDPQGAPNGLPVNALYQYYYDADGAGNGLTAFLTQTPDATIPSVPPYPCPGQTTSCIPYPEWDASATDGQLTAAQINCYQVGCTGINAAQPARGQYLQLPAFETDLTLPYNPTGQTVPNNGLQLSRNSYCGIYEGAITNWGDPSITSDNNGVQVSTQPITLIVRSDSAGATLLLTEHLNQACQNLANPAYDWTRGVGTSGISWPPNVLAEKGNSGIVNGVKVNSGAIGYVGPSYVAPVVPGGLPTALLQNHFAYGAHKLTFTAPTVNSTIAAFVGVAPPNNPNPWDLGLTILDPAQKTAYPIVGFVYFESYQCYQHKQTALGLRKVYGWAAAAGPIGTSAADKIVEAQGFAPINTTFKSDIRNFIKNIVAGPVPNVCTI